MKLVLPIALMASLAAGGAEASTKWTWTCTGPDFEAKGEFVTVDTPDADGFYAITAVTGEANGAAITKLQPAGSAIPGNEGWPVDDRVRATEPQLSHSGFGFAVADGSHVNPFYGKRFKPPGFLAVITTRDKWREPRVAFKAERAP